MERAGLVQSCDGGTRDATAQLRRAKNLLQFHVKFSHDLPIGLAVFGIITIFLAVWALLTGRDPKRWRQWWMAMLGMTDMSTTREQRRRHEFHVSIAGYVAFSLLLAASAVCAYRVVAELREQRQARSDYEQTKDKLIMEYEKIRSETQGRKR
jgi:hypothetical protein